MDLAHAQKLETTADELELQARRLRLMADEIRAGLSKPSISPDLLKTKISELGLSNRTVNCLTKECGFSTVEDLIHYSDDALRKIWSFGKTSLRELRDRVGPAQDPVCNDDPEYAFPRPDDGRPKTFLPPHLGGPIQR